MFRHIKWITLPVTDPGRAVAFYTERLGFRVHRDRPYIKDQRWIELAIPGAATRVLLTARGNTERAAAPALMLVVDDVEATHQRLSAAGVEFVQTPQQTPWTPKVTFAVFIDSENNTIVMETPAEDEPDDQPGDAL